VPVVAASPFISRQQRFPVVGSTSDVVREWLAAGEREICLAVADEQSAGRGRQGRTWSAPGGRALLLSLGFRPTWLAPDRTWRLAAIVSLAMADAAEEVASLADRAIRLKWPNDMVVEEGPATGGAGSHVAGGPAPTDGSDSKAGSDWSIHSDWPVGSDPPDGSEPGGGPGFRKLAGVLGETSGLGTEDPRAIIGIGINADWPAAEFPPDLASGMTSLLEASRGRSIDLSALLDAFLGRLEVRVAALRAGRFDIGDWLDRQLIVGRLVRLELPTGAAEVVRALGIDSLSGALIVEDRRAPAGERLVLSGEIRHLRLAPAAAGRSVTA